MTLATPILEIVLALAIFLLGSGLGIALGRRMRTAAAQSEQVARLENELRSARETEIVARTNLENAHQQVAEEKKRLGEIRAQMESTFEAMAADITRKNSATFLQQANQQFNSLKENSEKHLNEKKQLIDKSLIGMNERLDFIYRQATELKSSLDTSQKTTQTLSEHTAQLREILSSSQQRGQWGERMVEDILQVIGLVENVNYTKQRQIESGQRPDFTFILPKDKKLNMDVKFPLAHYENYIATDREDIKTQEKKAFLKDVRKHISSVRGREYIDPSAGTLEYVMLFIPNEAIYGFIHREDAKLVDEALASRVLLCSPLTLYAMLSLIHQATQSFTMNERASEVIELVNQFRHQWKKYVEQMDKLGRRIDGLSGDYHELINTRTRALERPLDRLENISLTAPTEEPAPLAKTPPLLE